MKFRKLFEAKTSDIAKVLIGIVKKIDRRFSYDGVKTSDYYGDNYNFSFETPEENSLDLCFTLDQDCVQYIGIVLLNITESDDEKKLFETVVKSTEKALNSYSKNFSAYTEDSYDSGDEQGWSLTYSRPKGGVVRIEN